jgi:uncharacterized protein (TIGR03437 family)
MQRNTIFIFVSILAAAGLLPAQSTFCTTSAVPPLVRAEGLAERIGDIILSCTGAPNAQFTGNFTFNLSAAVTNRLSGTNTLTGIVFTIDSGAGPQPTLVQPIMVNQSTLVFDGVAVVFSPQGTARLDIAGIRVNATQTPVQTPIVAQIAINAAQFPITTSPQVVGIPERGLFIGMIQSLICAQNGSPLPATITFTNLLATRTAFASTRVTEGFGGAFGPKSAPDYFNADSGQRIIVTYSGFPDDGRLFIPDVVAGSNATVPTAGGDFEIPASGGAYTPSHNGSLLLARVSGAGANGAGGAPVYLPGPIGSGTVKFDSVTEIPIVNGTAIAVYEVVDANPSSIETAQFPTFLGLLPNGMRTASLTSETVLFAPQSSVGFASATEPLPRFDAITPLPDCNLIGDCSFVEGALSVDTTPLTFSEPAGGATGQNLFSIANTGGGFMNWTTTVNYISGSGWLSLDPAEGTNTTNVRAYAAPGNLAPGTYQANIVVNAGPDGTASIPVTFVVTPGATPTRITPLVTQVLSSASLAAVPVVPGSLTTLVGTGLGGKNASSVSAAFNGMPATIVSSADTMMILVAPPGAALANQAQLVVTVDGTPSAPTSVQIASFEPAIFPGALLNQDGTTNSATNAAPSGNMVTFYATGLSGAGTISVRIGSLNLPSLNYAGPAIGWPGLQQVEFAVPATLPPGTSNLYVCGSTDGVTKVCSSPVLFTSH